MPQFGCKEPHCGGTVHVRKHELINGCPDVVSYNETADENGNERFYTARALLCRECGAAHWSGGNRMLTPLTHLKVYYFGDQFHFKPLSAEERLDLINGLLASIQSSGGKIDQLRKIIQQGHSHDCNFKRPDFCHCGHTTGKKWLDAIDKAQHRPKRN